MDDTMGFAPDASAKSLHVYRNWNSDAGKGRFAALVTAHLRRMLQDRTIPNLAPTPVMNACLARALSGRATEVDIQHDVLAAARNFAEQIVTDLDHTLRFQKHQASPVTTPFNHPCRDDLKDDVRVPPRGVTTNGYHRFLDTQQRFRENDCRIA